jgi:hypothetical protein
MISERSIFIALQDAKRLAFRLKGQDVMKLQIVRKPMVVFSPFLLAFLLVGCFGGGIDPTEDPVQPSGNNAAANAEENEEEEEEEEGENEELAANNAGLNENTANSEGGNNAIVEQGKDNGGADGEAINNAADDDFLNGNNNNLAEGGNGEANLLGNNLGKSNDNLGLSAGDQGDGALINSASEGILESPDVNKGATDAELMVPVAENPTAPSDGGPTMGGVVRYVIPGGSNLYDKPNGAMLRNLEQGDHPLVNEEGEWSRTSDGYYVPATSLTAAPIARLKQPKDWR